MLACFLAELKCHFVKIKNLSIFIRSELEDACFLADASVLDHHQEGGYQASLTDESVCTDLKGEERIGKVEKSDCCSSSLLNRPTVITMSQQNIIYEGRTALLGGLFAVTVTIILKYFRRMLAYDGRPSN